MQNNDDVLICDGLAIGYKELICSDIDLTLKEGQMLFVRGDNGAGKSTFVKTLIGEMAPLKGRYQWLIKPENISWLPQVTDVRLLFSYTVQEVLDIYNVPDEYMDFFSDRFKRKKIGETSRGEKQKVFILSRINEQTKTLILDEPFNHISQKGIESITNLLSWMLKKDRTLSIVLATHKKIVVEGFDVVEFLL